MREELTRFSRTVPAIRNSSGSNVQYEAALTRGSERIGGFGGKSDRLPQGPTFAGNRRSI